MQKTRIDVDTLSSRLMRGVAWSAAGIVVSRLSMLLSGVVAARHMSREGFGSLGIIQSTVAMFQVVASLSLGAAATKFVAESRVLDRDRAGRRLALCLALGGIGGVVSTFALAAFSGVLSEHALHQPTLAAPLVYTAPMLFFVALAGVVLGALAGFESYRATAAAHTAGGVAGILVTLIAVPRFGLNGAIAALLTMTVVQGLVGAMSLAHVLRDGRISLSLKGAWSERFAVLSFSIPATAAGMVSTPALWWSHALLVRSPGGVEQMAILGAANHWFAALSFVPLIVAQPLVSVMAERLSAGDTQAVRKVLRVAVQSAIWIAVPVVLLLIILSPWVMALYGRGYREGWPVLAILAVAAGLFIVQSPVGQLVIAAGRLWIGLAMNLAWGALLVAGSAVMLQQGAVGIASARALAYLAHGAWSLVVAGVILRGFQKAGETHASR